jgi:hypothetical protein
LENNQKVSLYISDILGNKVVELSNNKFFESGLHKIDFDTSILPAGVYFCNLRYGANVETLKIVVLK